MKFLLFVFVLFPLSAWAADYLPPITNKADCLRYDGQKYDNCIDLVNQKQKFDHSKWEYEQSRTQESKPDCFQGFMGNFGESVGRDYEHEQEKADQLRDAAERRLETLKSCRQELRESWLSFEDKKAEQARERALLPTKLKQAELDYQREMNRINMECQEKAKEDFANMF